MPTQVLAASAIAIHVAAGASDEPISEIWFKTEPLTSHIIYRLAQLQLWTDSHDEAFQVADAASAEGSWFELCILANETEAEPREQDGKALTWKSHSNRMGIEGMSRNFGAVFDRRGELLDALEPGNVIAVRTCVGFQGSINVAPRGELVAKVLEEALFSPQAWTLETVDTPDLPPTTGHGVYTITSTTSCELKSSSNELASQIWFSTPALDETVIAEIQEIQLFTYSHDQGYVTFPEAGSWSWFDIAVLESPDATTPKVRNGRSLVWASHTNDIGDDTLQNIHLEGKIFDLNHELFSCLEVGNVIAVRVCAQFVGWENYAKEGRLVVRIANSPEKPKRKKLDADITPQVKIDERIQDAIKAVYEASYSTALGLGLEPPPYTLNPPTVVTTELRADMPTGRDQRPLRILSLDGGGVRGVSSLRILEEIMNRVAPGAKPCEYFDMIGGTSTGGLIAIMLGRLEMTIPQCQAKYNELAKEVFGAGSFISKPFKKVGSVLTGARYSAKTLEECFKRIIKEFTGSEDTEMFHKDAKCKVVVTTVASDNVNNGGVVLARTYVNKDKGVAANPYVNQDDSGEGGSTQQIADFGWGQRKIWEAARATSAAPHYFDAMLIDGISFVDGGLGYNNPAPQLVSEARQCFGVESSFQCILSIGTGRIPNVHIGKVTVLQIASFVSGLLAISTSCEKGHEAMMDLASLLPDQKAAKYHRFNFGVCINPGKTIHFSKPGQPPSPKEPVENWEEIIGMDDWKNMGNFVQETAEWLKDDKVKKQVQACADRLKVKV